MGRLCTEVVGVIHDVKTNGLNAPVPDEIYLSVRQFGLPGMGVIARADGDPAGLQSAMRNAVASVDRNQRISSFATLETNVGNNLGVQRIVASLTAIFAALALVLSAVDCTPSLPTRSRSVPPNWVSGWRSARSAVRWSGW